MNVRCALLIAFGVGLLTLSAEVLGQGKERVWHVGFLWPRSHMEATVSDYYDEVEKGLRDLGYVEGKNLVIERRYADGKYDRLPELAAELVKLKVDVIVTDGTAGVLGAQKTTRTVPIVFGSAGDPVGNGLVGSLARPGGNTTGISLLAGDSIVNKQLEMLLSLVPNLTRVAALYNPANPYSLVVLKSLEAAALRVRVQIQRVEARTPQEIEEGFPLMTGQKAGAFIWLSDAVLVQQRRLIALLAAKHRIPGMGQGRGYAELGGLIIYGSNQYDNYRRAASMVDKIFKGANPGDLPVEQPMKVELVINRKTAQALGLAIPPELLLLADKVIE